MSLYSITMVLHVFIYFNTWSSFFRENTTSDFCAMRDTAIARGCVLHDTLNRGGTLTCKEHISDVNIMI